MTARVLLVGPKGHGGEEVYVATLRDNPPADTEYVVAGSFHEGARGAPSRMVEEIVLNRAVHPFLAPDIGFRSFALKDQFDLVHVHAHRVRLSGLDRVPLVMSEGSSSAVYLQDYLGWDDGRVDRAYSRARKIYRALGVHDRLLNLSRVDRVYVFSNWARDINLRWGADPAKMTVVYPGFPTPPEVARENRALFTFLFIGTDFERKGGYEVVEAFARFYPRHRNTRLVIISSDPLQSNPDRAIHSWVDSERRERVLDQLAKLEAAGVAERHLLLDRDRLLRDYYPRGDVFVMPSHAEGFGFTNVEALSFGMPVISSRIGAIPEAIRDGATGYLVEPGDVDTLASRMEQLVLDPAAAARMGGAARTDFLQRFTLERFRSEIGRVYKEAMVACAER